jgi:hypothetical protein
MVSAPQRDDSTPRQHIFSDHLTEILGDGNGWRGLVMMDQTSRPPRKSLGQQAFCAPTGSPGGGILRHIRARNAGVIEHQGQAVAKAQ